MFFGLAIFPTVSFMSLCIPYLRLSFGLPVFRCPLTSIIRVLVVTSSPVFLCTFSSHLCLSSLIFSVMFSTPALALIYLFLAFSILTIPFIHLNIFNLSSFFSKSCSAFISVHASRTYTKTYYTHGQR